VQLELFSPDRTALAEGWEAVGRLDLVRARGLFEGVLERWPGTTEAVEALRWLAVARERLAGFEGDAPDDLAARLWAVREAFPRHGFGGRFRQAVVLRLLWEMESRGVGGPSETPCRAEVLLEAGRPGASVRWLGEVMGTPGARSDLRRLLGLALWAAEHPKEARRQWLAWLLQLDSAEAVEAAGTLPDPEIARLVKDHGAEEAPILAWLEGTAPLLQDDELPNRQTPGLQPHRHVLAAEEARRRGDLEAAVAHREALLHLDPRLLRRYMDRLG